MFWTLTLDDSFRNRNSIQFFQITIPFHESFPGLVPAVPVSEISSSDRRLKKSIKPLCLGPKWGLYGCFRMGIYQPSFGYADMPSNTTVHLKLMDCHFYGVVVVFRYGRTESSALSTVKVWSNAAARITGRLRWRGLGLAAAPTSLLQAPWFQEWHRFAVLVTVEQSQYVELYVVVCHIMSES